MATNLLHLRDVGIVLLRERSFVEHFGVSALGGLIAQMKQAIACAPSGKTRSDSYGQCYLARLVLLMSCILLRKLASMSAAS
jgi:hypothetical protein